MNLFDDLKAKADANGDGKITAADLDGLKQEYQDQLAKLDGLKDKADTSGDGKVSFDDAKSAFGDLGDKLGGLKDKLFG